MTSEDPEFGYSKQKAIQVGGGPMYLASRERRYLDALRGPGAVRIQYRRLGQIPLAPPNDTTILDAYEVTYPGLEKPVVLHLDGYHFDDDLRAPRGFTCGTPIPLSDPGPDSFVAMDSLVKVALQDATAADAPGIPLDSAGTGAAGVAFDRFRLIAREARVATKAGKPLVYDPGSRIPSLRPRTVVVALPRTCQGKLARASAIELSVQFQNGYVPAPREGDYATGDAISGLIPGYAAPPSAVAATFSLESLRPNERVRISYEDPCASEPTIAQVAYTAAELLASPSPALPPGAAPPRSSVRVQVTVDLNGSFQDPTYIGGAEQLLEAASLAVRTTWKARPARINNAPVSTPVTLLVQFGK